MKYREPVKKSVANIFVGMYQGLGLEVVLFTGIFNQESYWWAVFDMYVLI